MRLLWVMAMVVTMRDVTSSAHHPSEDVSAEVISSDATSEGVTSADAPSPESEEQRSVALSEPGQDKSDAKLLFPLVYTTTVTAFSIQSVTSTIPFTCFNVLTGTTTPCTGRRRRRRSGRLAKKRALEAPALTAGDPQLMGSFAEDRGSALQSQSSRLVLTTWVTSVSSITSVSTVTKYDTTVSLGLLCTVGGSSFFSFCP